MITRCTIEPTDTVAPVEDTDYFTAPLLNKGVLPNPQQVTPLDPPHRMSIMQALRSLAIPE